MSQSALARPLDDRPVDQGIGVRRADLEHVRGTFPHVRYAIGQEESLMDIGHY